MWPVGVRSRRVETGGEREEERRVVSGLVRSIVCEVVVVVCSADEFRIWAQELWLEDEAVPGGGLCCILWH